MGTPFTDTQRSVREELLRVEEDCTHTGKSHYEACSRWGRYHYWIGVPAVVIGALAGGAFFTEWPKVGSALALVAALLTALQTFLRPADHAATHKAAGDAYGALKNDSRLLREVRLRHSSDEEAMDSVTDINQRRNALNSTSPLFWRSDRRKALKGIAGGETEYDVDRRV